MSGGYGKVSSHSWFSRPGSARGGILAGVALACAAVGLPFILSLPSLEHVQASHCAQHKVHQPCQQESSPSPC